MRQKELREMRELIRQARERSKNQVLSFTGCDNPQVIEMRLKAEAEVEAYNNVLDAISGSFTMLRLAAGSPELTLPR